MRIVIDTQDDLGSPAGAVGATQPHLSESMTSGGGAPTDLIAQTTHTRGSAAINAGGPPAHLMQLFETQRLADIAREETAEPKEKATTQTKPAASRRRRGARG